MGSTSKPEEHTYSDYNISSMGLRGQVVEDGVFRTELLDPAGSLVYGVLSQAHRRCSQGFGRYQGQLPVVFINVEHKKQCESDEDTRPWRGGPRQVVVHGGHEGYHRGGSSGVNEAELRR
jgi:hypothetical protein